LKTGRKKDRKNEIYEGIIETSSNE
jgi:hypothetical protein